MSHRHLSYGEEPHATCVEIGDGVCIRNWRRLDGQPTFMVAHERDVPFDPAIHASERCEGRVPVGPDGWTATGTLEAGDLTLSPSVLCTNLGGTCGGSHGFVQNGKWVPS